jgi:hypothetical protein
MELNDSVRALSDQRDIVWAEAGMLPNDDIPFGDRRFDLITAFDVLEHIDADFETLPTLRARSAAGGKLLITVPAFRSSGTNTTKVTITSVVTGCGRSRSSSSAGATR